MPESAAYQMERLGCDLYHWGGHDFLVTVDRFSGYIWTHRLSRTGTDQVTKALTNIFQTFGYPVAIRTDNGPQFRGPFSKFCKDNGILHEPASPYHPQSNGLAENAVKTCKKLREKAKRSGITFEKALYAWTATPRADGASPAFLLLGYHPRLLGLPRLALPVPNPVVADREQRNVSLYDKRGGKHLSLSLIHI